MSAWFDNSWIESQRRRIADGVEKAAEMLAQRMIEKVSTPGPPASEPGDPPHDERDILQATIAAEIIESDENQITACVGSPVPEALFTELGTSKMAPRPWCASTLAENLEQVEALVVRS